QAVDQCNELLLAVGDDHTRHCENPDGELARMAAQPRGEPAADGEPAWLRHRVDQPRNPPGEALRQRGPAPGATDPSPDPRQPAAGIDRPGRGDKADPFRRASDAADHAVDDPKVPDVARNAVIDAVMLQDLVVAIELIGERDLADGEACDGIAV